MYLPSGENFSSDDLIPVVESAGISIVLSAFRFVKTFNVSPDNITIVSPFALFCIKIFPPTAILPINATIRKTGHIRFLRFTACITLKSAPHFPQNLALSEHALPHFGHFFTYIPLSSFCISLTNPYCFTQFAKKLYSSNNFVPL